MKIKTLFVDLGGVLIVNKAREVGEQYEKSDGLTPEMTKDAFRYIQTAKRTEDETKLYLEDKGIEHETWKRFLTDFYASETQNDDLIKLLNKAKESGITVVYTTNNSQKLENLIKKYHIDEIPNLIINSSEANVAKPDPKFWEVALNETRKLLPELEQKDVLVIDDSKTNCASANDFGFKSFLYTDTPESQEKISEIIF